MARTPSQDQLLTFFSSGTGVSTEKGELISRSDASRASVFLIEAGYVKSYTIMGDGGYNILAIYGPGAIFPLGPALRGEAGRLSYHLRDTIYFEAMTRVAAFQRSKDELVTLASELDGLDSMYMQLANLVLDNYEIFLARIEGGQFKHAHQRIAYQLLVFASRFGAPIHQQTIIELPLTHQDIADSLGLARETVSREIEKLSRRGLVISKDRHIIIPDLDTLEAELK